jgi:hypothetical protein
MNRAYRPILAMLLTVWVHAQGQKIASPSGKEFVSGRILIKFKPQQDAYAKKPIQQSEAAQMTLQKIGSITQTRVFPDASPSSEQKQISEEVGLDRWVVATVPVVVDIENLVAQLKRDPHVEIAEPDYIETIHAIPDDPLYPSQQHLPQIKASQAWDIRSSSRLLIPVWIGIIRILLR